MNIPLVSISCITYNQEHFIAQTIKGFLIQQTNFNYEINITDDCSSDNTKAIIQSYVQKFPEKFKVTFLEKNIGSISNFMRNIQSCSGKYIALCEGDDYWTDPFKLQKQVDFLETHKEFTACFTNAQRFFQNTQQFKPFYASKLKHVYEYEDFLYENIIPTLTCIFRNDIIFPSWYESVFPGDWVLHILNSKKGKIAYLPEITGVYRHHDNGFCSANNPIINNKKYIKTFKFLFWVFDFKSKIIILNTLSRIYNEQVFFYKRDGKVITSWYYKFISKIYYYAYRSFIYLYR